MSFSWSEYLDLCKELCGQKGVRVNPEAKRRAAVSRAYYAAFCTARNHLLNRCGIIVSTQENVHKRVSDEFSQSGDRRRQQIGNWLKKMHRQRKRADYQDTMDDASQQAEINIQLADRVLKNLAQLR